MALPIGPRPFEHVAKKVMQRAKEPIAIVGIGCRFPGGASSPKAYWNMLRRKKDAIVDVPEDRWDERRFYDGNPDKPGKMYIRQGGFLKEKIDRFDPLFFGISPREAENMDPQQRLLLEVSWEAFEDAGWIESDIAGSRTGVFMGGFCMDSMLLRFGQLNRELANTHSAASSTMTMLSNRISYVFDLKGPSLSLDTACSSSLVAAHHGCQSLWNGECDTAIVGGVNVMLRPEFPIVMCKGKFLSPHGRCKAFDEDAAGYVRGEGAGVVLLKPLAKAMENGDRIYGMVRETGVNQDGRTAGITLPDSKSQERLMRDVYGRAGVAPSDIDYIEAHGTGTQAGDPAEISALDSVLGEGRPPDSECYAGSVKTNIGHLEAGAGVAGLIKAVLSLHHEKILPNLHFQNPSSKIEWEEICIRVPTAIIDWKRGSRTRYAGVNSFGYGGSNAHILLEESPIESGSPESADRADDRPFVIPVSARSEQALRDVAGKYAFHVSSQSDPHSLEDFRYTAACRRFHHPHRAAIVASDADSLRNRLQRFSEGESPEQVVVGRADADKASKLVFVFTGMGPQWWAMGRELMPAEPVFREAIERCDDEFSRQAGWSIREELEKPEAESRMSRTEIAQPANFVLQVGLSELWKSWGVKPFAVVGHSVGEVASAYVSGALSLADATTVSLHRSRLQQSLSGSGSMAAVGLGEDAALDLIAESPGVSIAAINSPSSVTISGDEAQIDDLARKLEEGGIFVRKLNVEVAYHSPQMEPIEEELLEALAGIGQRSADTPLFSTVAGHRVDGVELDAGYWWRNVRRPVRFLDCVRALLEEGVTDFLEIGPHPVLGHSIKEIASQSSVAARVTPSLNRKVPERERMLESLGMLYSQGHDALWERANPPGGRLTRLPAYPWQRERYWIESIESRQDRLGLEGHAFLNKRLAGPIPAWTVDVNNQFFPYLEDHVVNGRIVFPGAAYIEAGLVVCREILGGETWTLSDLRFRSMLLVEPQARQQVSVSFYRSNGEFMVHSKSSNDEFDWQLHASGFGGMREVGQRVPGVELERLRERISDVKNVEAFYSRLRRRGLEYGSCFRCVSELRALDDEVFARIEIGEYDGWNADSILHPEISDAAFHTILAIVPGDQPYVPVSAEKVVFRKQPGLACWYHGIVRKRDRDSILASMYLLDEEGEVCVEVENAFMRTVPMIAMGGLKRFEGLFYAPKWQPMDECVTTDALQGHYLVFTNGGDGEDAFLDRIRALGGKVATASREDAFSRLAEDSFALSPENESDFESLLEETNKQGPRHFIYFWTRDCQHGPDLEEMAQHCLALARLARAINRVCDSPCGITIVTENAQPVIDSDSVVGINASPAWGLGQVIENEFGNIHCQLVDCESLETDIESEILANALLSVQSRDIAFRGGLLFERTLNRLDINESAASMETTPANNLDESIASPSGTTGVSDETPLAERRYEGAFLITGGNSGFGLSVARWLGERGASRVIIVSRSGLKRDELNSDVESIRELGVDIQSELADVSDAGQMDALRERLSQSGDLRLQGVFHGAMVLDDRYLTDIDANSFRKVMAPKVSGALNAFRIAEALQAEIFVNFSSISSLIGNRGQGNYCAANAFLDVFPRWASKSNLVVKTINWGALSESGVVSRNAQLGGVLEKEGIKGLSDREAFSALERSLELTEDQVGVFDVEWASWAQANPKAAKSKRFEPLTSKESGNEESGKAASLGRSLLDMEAADRFDRIADLILTGLGGVLKIPENRIDASQRLENLGIDSLLLIELSLTIQSEFGVNIPASELPKFPTAEALTKRVVECLLEASGQT